MKLDSSASGVYSIAPTPFQDDGRIDWDSVDRMTDFYFACGCQGFTILGVLGEAPKLDADEALELAARVIKRAAGKPIIVGVSAPGFAAMRSLSGKVMDMGAAGVMIAPGAGLKNDDAIETYFRNAVEAVGADVPWVLQDYPHSTGVTIPSALLKKIVNAFPSLAVVKHEDWPGLDKITALRDWERDGSMRKISILVGNNGLFLDFELDRGVDGANTGYAFPDMLVEAVELSRTGKRDAVHDLFDAHLPLLRYDHQPGVGLAVRKYILMRRGVLSSPAMRKPAPSFSAQTRADVDYLLARLAHHDPRARV
jgi:4-hydroxy-tetrahydrodipicolinate synthase